MQIPIKCPICEGKCIVPNGFYNSYKYTGQFLSSSTTEMCRQCSGRGIIWVESKCDYQNHNMFNLKNGKDYYN